MGIFGKTLIPTEEINNYIGPPLQSSFPELLQTHDKATISRAADLFRHNMLCSGYAENKLYPGMQDLLKHLADQGNNLFIVTNRFQSVLEKIVDNFSIRNYFKEMIGSNGNSSKSQIISELIRKYELPRDAIVAVGDREADITAAADNGIKSILVLWGFASEDEKRSSKCTSRAGNLDELRLLLK